MQTNQGWSALVAVSLCALFGAGCSQQTITSASHDAAHDVAVVGQKAHEAERAARPQLDKLGTGARVTAALQANANLPHSIRVDAGPDGVTLRGKVKTPEQKALAGRIARDTLPPDKSVTNQLVIKDS